MLVFVYGTLTDPDRVASVLDGWAFEGGAVLEGLRRVEGRYPTLVPPDGGEQAGGGGTEGAATADASVEGRLLRTPDVDALDAYEGVDHGLYVRVAVPVAARDETAAVYVGDPDRLGADEGWPGDGGFEERVRRFVADRAVVVRPGG